MPTGRPDWGDSSDPTFDRDLRTLMETAEKLAREVDGWLEGSTATERPWEHARAELVKKLATEQTGAGPTTSGLLAYLLCDRLWLAVNKKFLPSRGAPPVHIAVDVGDSKSAG